MLPQPPLWLVLIAFICALGPLVFFHELGHYLVGRLFGVPAEAFSIGFGQELFGWTDKRGTRWKVAWLPLGGYVKFLGDMNAAGEAADMESIPEDLRDQVFQVRPVWQRFLIVLAGPATNFLIAILIFSAFFSFIGVPLTNVVGSTMPGSAAAKAGLQPGDRILEIAGHSTSTFDDISNVVSVRANETVPVRLERAGRIATIKVSLQQDDRPDPFGQKTQRGLLGIHPSTEIRQPVAPWHAVPMAAAYTLHLTQSIVDGLAQIVLGHVSVKELGGPIKIAQIAGQGASLGLLPFVELIALFSINLGFINLLPVPMLDGGHLFFYIIEAARRRPVSSRAMEWAFRGGLAVILALVVFVTVNDLGSVGLWDRLGRLID